MDETAGKGYLFKGEPELILQQVINETEQRPVLKEINPPELLTFIQKKLAEREPYYSEADFTLNVKDLNENSISGFL